MQALQKQFDSFYTSTLFPDAAQHSAALNRATALMAEDISDEATLSQFYDNLQVFFGIEDVNYDSFFQGLFQQNSNVILNFFLTRIDDPIVLSRIYDIPDIHVIETILQSIEEDDIVLEVLNDVVLFRKSIWEEFLNAFSYRDGQFYRYDSEYEEIPVSDEMAKFLEPYYQ